MDVGGRLGSANPSSTTSAKDVLGPVFVDASGGFAQVNVNDQGNTLATTYTLTHWTRDRGRGALFPVSWIIKRLTSDNAAAIGLNDRGLLRVGMKADINVLDYDKLRLRPPEIAYDLPAGGKRLLQRTDGIDATIVSGAVVYRHGEATGALPGRLIRGARAP